MKRYNVWVGRWIYGHRVIEVEAEDVMEAQEKALDEAVNYEFTCNSSDYEVDYIEEIDGDKS